VFLESQTGIVVIPDIEAAVVEEMLVYCYTDALSDVTVLTRLAVPLLVASSKYQISSLFCFVEEYLCLQLTVDNALEMLALADAHSAAKLKELAMRIVISNALVLTSTSEYKYLHPTIVSEIETSLDHQQRLQKCCLASSGGGAAGGAAGGAGAGNEAGAAGGGRRASQCIVM